MSLAVTIVNSSQGMKSVPPALDLSVPPASFPSPFGRGWVRGRSIAGGWRDLSVPPASFPSPFGRGWERERSIARGWRDLSVPPAVAGGWPGPSPARAMACGCSNEIDLMRPRGTELRTVTPCSTPSNFKSSTYKAAPVTFLRPSLREMGLPTRVIGSDGMLHPLKDFEIRSVTSL